MSEIKSQKAIELINANSWYPKEILLNPRSISVRAYIAEEAVIIAETEAEERHANEIAKYNQSLDEAKQREQLSQNVIAEQRKQLQELRDKAVEAYRQRCPSRGGYSGDSCWPTPSSISVRCNSDCDYMKSFTKKLTEKQ